MNITKSDVRFSIFAAMFIGAMTIAASAFLCFLVSDIFHIPWIWGLMFLPTGYWLYLLPDAVRDWRS